MKRLILTVLAAFAIALGVAPAAQASPQGMGCETIHWGFLGSPELRTICDGHAKPTAPGRAVVSLWRPAHYVSASSYCGTYSCSYSGGYYVEEHCVRPGELRGVRVQRAARRTGLAPGRNGHAPMKRALVAVVAAAAVVGGLHLRPLPRPSRVP